MCREEFITNRLYSVYIRLPILPAGRMEMEVRMLYPAYVHKDKGSAYGLTFPDFPGCFSAADELADLSRMAQEAVEVHLDGEEMGSGCNPLVGPRSRFSAGAVEI